MKSNNSSKEINISLRKIIDIKFCYNSVSNCKEFSEDKFPYNISIKYHISHNIEKDTFNIDLLICYKDGETLILDAENRFVFYIKNLGNFIVMQDNDTFSLSVDFLPALLNIAIGSMRGIIFSRTAGSSLLSDFPLPMISIDKLRNKPIKK